MDTALEYNRTLWVLDATIATTHLLFQQFSLKSHFEPPSPLMMQLDLSSHGLSSAMYLKGQTRAEEVR